MAPYLPWLGLHLDILLAGSKHELVISAMERDSWYASTAEMRRRARGHQLVDATVWPHQSTVGLSSSQQLSWRRNAAVACRPVAASHSVQDAAVDIFAQYVSPGPPSDDSYGGSGPGPCGYPFTSFPKIAHWSPSHCKLTSAGSWAGSQLA